MGRATTVTTIDPCPANRRGDRTGLIPGLINNEVNQGEPVQDRPSSAHPMAM